MGSTMSTDEIPQQPSCVVPCAEGDSHKDTGSDECTKDRGGCHTKKKDVEHNYETVVSTMGHSCLRPLA
jgi:hypothetical protein